MNPLTDAELQEIAHRCGLATAGPWKWGPGDTDIVYVDDGDKDEVCTLSTSGGRDAKNGNFIAHAREDVPRLLAEIERLRSLVAAGKAAQMEAVSEMAKLHVVQKTVDLADRFRVETKSLGQEKAERLMLCECIRTGFIPHVQEAELVDPRNKRILEAMKHIEQNSGAGGSGLNLVAVAEVLNGWGYMKDVGYDYLGIIWDEVRDTNPFQ